MRQCPHVALGEMLDRATELTTLSLDDQYHEVTIKLWGKGVVSRGKVRGSDVTTARRFVRAGQFILSKIDARNGAVGIVPPELNGAIVSNDFPSFEVRDSKRLSSAYLGWLARSSGFVELCKAASEGTTNRVRIKESRFLEQKIPLPPLAEQQTIVAHLDALADKTRRLIEHLDAIEADACALARAYLFGDPARSYPRKPMSELVRLRSPDVVVDRTQFYRFAGVYSFGRGVFASVNKAGNGFAYDRLSTVRTGDFTYPKLMAWEGALGVVPPECNDRVVSPEFPVFSVDAEVVLPEILDIYFRTPAVWPQLAALSGGTNVRRRRLQPSAFLRYEIPVPPLSVQRKIRELHQRTTELKGRHAAIRAANAALLPATLERLFTCVGGVAPS